ncbi:MAG: hypothetical protein NTY26_17610 [Burkholderiales bacterium]|nr:hypothetical protein [Burkholderiales bacterium]
MKLGALATMPFETASLVTFSQLLSMAWRQELPAKLLDNAIFAPEVSAAKLAQLAVTASAVAMVAGKNLIINLLLVKPGWECCCHALHNQVGAKPTRQHLCIAATIPPNIFSAALVMEIRITNAPATKWRPR